VVCRRQPSDPHHVPFGHKRALGRKVSDDSRSRSAEPANGNSAAQAMEFRWWEAVGIDPLKVARKLWKKTRLASMPARKSDRCGLVLRLAGAD